ncbi:hypothetical protein DXG01_003499 [Tephrocybe rancida]|nr:hypothetical protein DXG01_003499 [Tephrocybe rancida]
MFPQAEDLCIPIGNPPPYQWPEKGELYEVWHSVPSSPSPSNSTASSAFTLEDNDIRQVFTEKPNCLPGALSDSSLYEGDCPDFSSLVRPIPEDDLNPHAAPFVPKKPSPKSRRLLRPDPGTMLQPRITRWKRTFNLATRPPIEDNHNQTLIVVAAQAWTPEQIAELAQEFCWRFAEATADDIEAILTFMLRLYWQFKRMRSEEVANTFEWHLKEALLGTFISVWDANENEEAISYDRATPKFVASGLMLAVAIGQLFRRGFLDTKDIHNCLKTLMSNFLSVEHADAVAAMFHHIGPDYWYQHPDGPGHLREFQFAFGCIMQKLEGKMTVLNNPRTQEQLSLVMNKVATQILELYEQMVMATTAAMQMHMQRPAPPTISAFSEDPIHYAGQGQPHFATQAQIHVGQGHMQRRLG